MKPLVALVAASLLTGCVTRTMYVDSAPQGAAVWIDGVKVGSTPYEETFVSYGSRFVELEAPGHRRFREVVELDQPWWQTPPIDLFFDLFFPFPLRSDHRFAFELEPIDPDARSQDDARAAYAEMRAAVEAFETEDDEP